MIKISKNIEKFMDVSISNCFFHKLNLQFIRLGYNIKDVNDLIQGNTAAPEIR